MRSKERTNFSMSFEGAELEDPLVNEARIDFLRDILLLGFEALLSR